MFLLAGCGADRTTNDRTATNMEQTVQHETDKAEENIVREDDFQVIVENNVMPKELQDLLTGNLVWVEAGDYCGSGYIWSMEGDLLIVTAAHVLEDVSKGVKVRLWDGYEVSVNEHFISTTSDLAFLKIDGERIPLLRKERYATAPLEKVALDKAQEGDRLYVMGYTGSDTVCINEGTLINKWIYVEDFEQYMILAQIDIAHGMSGGALLDAEGYCIGIISGKSEDGEMVAVPYHVITAEMFSVAWS